MAAAPFPLRELSKRDYETVLTLFNLQDLITFSMISKKCRMLPTVVRRRQGYLEVSISRDGTILHLSERGNPKIKWAFNDRIRENPRSFIWEIDDNRMEMHLNETEVSIKPISAHFSYVSSAIKYLKELLRWSVKSVNIDPANLPNTMNLADLKVEKCKILYIFGTRIISDQELTAILENVQKKNFLKINIMIYNDFLFIPNLLNCKRLLCEKPTQWLTLDKLFQLNCTKFIFKQSRFKVQGCIDFMEDWMDGNGEGIDYLLVKFATLETKDPVILPYLEDIDVVEHRSSGYILNQYTYLDCEDGYDIKHDSGKVATWQVAPDYFYFVVWHNLQHNILQRTPFEF
ncbi:hypothetical protein CRE_30936 [Caenorhabditis remanei]|uniref:F-box domain-containing protein n=1 Tax=Caenorhabditis remanei TaxID=31234 RepID=E3LTN2_CAERE|nr:hypothetical protein CRE_30936 [Caenorhabditis remanei]